MNTEPLAVLIVAAILGLSGCGDSEPMAQKVEWDGYDSTLTLPDGSTVKMNVFGEIPPACDYSLPVTMPSDCIDIPIDGCDFATFRMEDTGNGISTAMPAPGQNIDPTKTEITLRVVLEDCPSLPTP